MVEPCPYCLSRSRDVRYTVLFLLQSVITLTVSFKTGNNYNVNSASPNEAQWIPIPDGVRWGNCLNLGAAMGLFLSCMFQWVLMNTRLGSFLAKRSLHAAVALEIILSVGILAFSRVHWPLAVVLGVMAVNGVRWGTRLKDSRHFLGMLVDMVVEVLGEVRGAAGVPILILLLQVMYLIWWGRALSSSLTGTSMSSGWGGSVLVLMLFNLYWTCQVFRGIMVVFVSGTMSSCCTSDNRKSKGSGFSQELVEGKGYLDEYDEYLNDDVLVGEGGRDGGDTDGNPLVSGRNESHDSVSGSGRPKERGSSRENTLVENTLVAVYLRIALTSSFGSACKGAILSPLGQLRSMVTCLTSRVREPSGRQISRGGRCVDAFESLTRGYHDLALVHVGAYSTAYSPAVDEVWKLLRQSGLEAVFAEDLVGPAMNWLSVSMAVLTAAAIGAAPHGHAADRLIFFTFLVFYVVRSCMQTGTEVLRSAVYAVYLQFVDNPHSLGERFSLIYHRLERVSELWKYQDQLWGVQV
ncbi:unnamed protein product [Choristocarpus tenellus]